MQKTLSEVIGESIKVGLWEAQIRVIIEKQNAGDSAHFWAHHAKKLIEQGNFKSAKDSLCRAWKFLGK